MFEEILNKIIKWELVISPTCPKMFFKLNFKRIMKWIQKIFQIVGGIVNNILKQAFSSSPTLFVKQIFNLFELYSILLLGIFLNKSFPSLLAPHEFR